jgi:GNAT superfamily N-acetyltransferase
MNAKADRVKPVGWRDMLAVTRMTFDNMIGVDRYFTRMVQHPLGRWFTFVTLPFYLRFSGQGFKVLVGERIAACGFLHLRRHSGYIFNVNVSEPYRRQGLGRRLVTHLEAVTHQNDLGWAALHVDRGNEPAEGLYRQLGYRAYHPSFLRRASGSPVSRAATSGVSIQPMARQPGKALFRRYQEMERRNGDFWAAAVVDEYESHAQKRGAFWRCRLYEHEIGCAQVVNGDGRLLIRLAMARDYWGHLAIGGVAKELVDSRPDRAAHVDLFLASSAHHRAAMPVLNGLGFRERFRTRTLMLKALQDAAALGEDEKTAGDASPNRAG